MQMERRSQYRVTSEEVSSLHATIRTPGGVYSLGEPVDLSISGVGTQLLMSLGFAATSCPTLVVGEEVTLYLGLSEAERPLELSARVMNRTDEGELRRYGFEFTDREQLECQLSPVLHRLFNRRHAYRIEPDPDSPIEVMLICASPTLQVRARLVDISTNGMAFDVPLDAESALAAVDRLVACVGLPGGGQPPRLGILTRNRSLLGNQVRHGVEFDLKRTQDAQRQQDAVARYVMDRQRTLIRQRVHH